MGKILPKTLSNSSIRLKESEDCPSETDKNIMSGGTGELAILESQSTRQTSLDNKKNMKFKGQASIIPLLSSKQRIERKGSLEMDTTTPASKE